jgi:hypothetical protein
MLSICFGFKIKKINEQHQQDPFREEGRNKNINNSPIQTKTFMQNYLTVVQLLFYVYIVEHLPVL